MVQINARSGLKSYRMFSQSRWIAVCAVVLAMTATLFSQAAARPSRITQTIVGTQLVTLHGNVRADLTADRDLGVVDDGMQLHLYLVLRRSPEQQAALDNLIARQQQPTAPEYHHWLTPQQYGERFGVSQQDISKISAWLESQGMHVNAVMNNAMFIDFTANARDLREVFRTQLHYYNIQGGKYAANAQDPMIPAALAPVVAGIQGLVKIPRLTNHTKLRQASHDASTHLWHHVDSSGSTPTYANGPGEYDVTPHDFYTIYDVNNVFIAGNLGDSANVAVIEESDFVFGTPDPSTGATDGGDVATFRNLFGVPGTLNMHVYHGYGIVSCKAPGIDPNGIGEEEEAALDAEWANALAPNANLIFMSCDQYPDQGITSSMMALIDNNLSDVMSLSYGASEIGFTSSDYSTQDALYTQAATQGQSIFVSAGDSGSDVKDQNTTGTATSGINVSAFGSPNVTVAGGTDFSDTYDSIEGGPPQTRYWGTTNTANYDNALGYVPETAWNSSCASSLIAKSQGFTGAGFCALGPNQNGIGYVDGAVVGGSGGFSAHYAVPSYQAGIAGYSGTKRAQPDISGFAANGIWGHALIACDSHIPSYSCTSPDTFGEAGGTSFVAPYMAGIGGLLVNYTGSRQGLLNPVLYALAKAQFTAAPTLASCYSNGQTSNTGVTTGLPASACIFNDVTTSNNDVPCAKGSTNCYVNKGASYGMLSLSNASSLTVAYPSAPNYDEATGIGTVNVYNLLTNWNTAFSSTTDLGTSATSILSTQSLTLTAQVTTGTPPGYASPAPPLTGTVSFTAGASVLDSCVLSSGICSATVSGSALQAGDSYIYATFLGSGTYPASASNVVTVSVAEVSATTVTAAPSPVTIGGTTTLTAVVTPASATGTVLFQVGAKTLGTAEVFSGTATLAVTAGTSYGFLVGANAITATYSGDSLDASSSATTNLTVLTNTTTTTLTSNPTTIALGSSKTAQSFTAKVTAGTGTPTGKVTFQVGSVTVGSAELSEGSATLSGVAPTTEHGFVIGSDTVTATYAPAAIYAASSSTATLAVTAPAYTITPTATSVSLTKGTWQTVTVALDSTTFADTTNWTATSSSPLLIEVSPTSGTATLAANGTSTIQLAILASSMAANRAPALPWTAGLMAFGVVLAGIPLAQRRRRVAALLLVALAISALAFVASCSGNTPAPVTDNYTVTIKGTGGVSSTISVTVQ